MSNTLLDRVRTWIAAHDAASAARDAEIAEHGFEVNDDRWLDVLALMPPVREIAEGLVASAAEVENLRADLATARRLLPPRYVAADGSLLDPERCTPHAPDCAECGRGRAHDEGCLALLPTPAEEAVGLRAEVERLKSERAALLAPVEEVDLEGVLELDEEAPPAPWDLAWPTCVTTGGRHGDRIADGCPEEAAELIVCYRTAAPALAREVIRLRAELERVREGGLVEPATAPDPSPPTAP